MVRKEFSMGIKKDPNNPSFFIVQYSKRHPLTGVPISMRRTKVKTMAQAKRVERELIIQMEEKIRQKIIPTWIDCIERFCEAARDRGLQEKTITDYRYSLKAHTVVDWGERLIDSIHSSEIRELIKDKVGHRSPSQQKNLLKFIRAVFTQAMEDGHIVSNPTPNIKFRLGDKIKKVLTEPMVKSFLSQAKNLDVEWYPHWCMALYTGMRNGALFALTWDKVNLEEGTILVDSSWNNKDGFKSTKSGDDRLIVISKSLLPLLKRLKFENTGSHFVLPRIDKWEKGEQARELRMFLIGIGLEPVRFHDLRASWATILLSKGVEPIKVMKMGGWKDMKTMMIYVRKAGVDIKGATDCLDFHDTHQPLAKVVNFDASSRA